MSRKHFVIVESKVVYGPQTSANCWAFASGHGPGATVVRLAKHQPNGTRPKDSAKPVRFSTN